MARIAETRHHGLQVSSTRSRGRGATVDGDERGAEQRVVRLQAHEAEEGCQSEECRPEWATRPVAEGRCDASADDGDDRDTQVQGGDSPEPMNGEPCQEQERGGDGELRSRQLAPAREQSPRPRHVHASAQRAAADKLCSGGDAIRRCREAESPVGSDNRKRASATRRRPRALASVPEPPRRSRGEVWGHQHSAGTTTSVARSETNPLADSKGERSRGRRPTQAPQAPPAPEERSEALDPRARGLRSCCR